MNLYKQLVQDVKLLLRTSIMDDDFPEVKHRALSTLQQIEFLPQMPHIVCLCGSTRFKEQFVRKNFELTMSGSIVLSVGCFSHADSVTYTPTEEEKFQLDGLHKRKIDLADYIFVLNVGGYIGDSTRSEIEYAKVHEKPIIYLEEPT